MALLMSPAATFASMILAVVEIIFPLTFDTKDCSLSFDLWGTVKLLYANKIKFCQTWSLFLETQSSMTSLNFSAASILVHIVMCRSV